MSASTATLLLYVASFESPGFVSLLRIPDLCASLPEARTLGLIESPSEHALDQYHVRLTARGRMIVDEILAVGRELMR